jgi:hypothetical protein
MSFMLALLILLDADETLVEVRARCLPAIVAVGFELVVSCRLSGCGKGTGVETFACEFDCVPEEAITAT